MKVLLVKLSSMGDVIHTLPAITDAASAIPNIKFTWIVEPGFAEIAQWHSAVEKVIPVPLRKRKISQITAALQQIRSQYYDLVIDAQGLIKSAIIAKLARANTILGFDRHSIREPMASILYTKKIPCARDKHAVVRLRELFARALGYALPDTPLDYGLQAIETTLSLQKDVAKPYLVFLHGTTWESKLWPDKHWIGLAEIAAQHGYNVQVTWATPEQRARAEYLAKQCANVIMLPHLTINQAREVLTAARGVVAVDTGFAHLSAALAKPTVAIYGPTAVHKCGTLGKRCTNLGSKYSCAPCEQRRCKFINDKVVTPPCFEELSPVLVWENLVGLI